MAYNKFLLENADGSQQVLLDLTGDTVAENTLIEGVTAHDKFGNSITGTAVIPTKTSQLENDSGFITLEDVADVATKVEVDDVTIKINDEGKIYVNTATDVASNSALPITAAAVYAELGNVENLLQNI